MTHNDYTIVIKGLMGQDKYELIYATIAPWHCAWGIRHVFVQYYEHRIQDVRFLHVLMMTSFVSTNHTLVGRGP
jgi:hypothetical protein